MTARNSIGLKKLFLAQCRAHCQSAWVRPSSVSQVLKPNNDTGLVLTDDLLVVDDDLFNVVDNVYNGDSQGGW